MSKQQTQQIVKLGPPVFHRGGGLDVYSVLKNQRLGVCRDSVDGHPCGRKAHFVILETGFANHTGMMASDVTLEQVDGGYMTGPDGLEYVAACTDPKYPVCENHVNPYTS